MTRLRCSSENEVASPVVPSTFSPSQPLSSRKRASAVERAQSGSPLSSTAVAMAAMTPCSLSLMLSPWKPDYPLTLNAASAAMLTSCASLAESGTICTGRSSPTDWADDGGAAQLLQQLGRD